MSNSRQLFQIANINTKISMSAIMKKQIYKQFAIRYYKLDPKGPQLGKGLT